MSQWGEERIFASETATIRVLPDFDTGIPFDPLHLEAKVRALFMVDQQGDKDECVRLFLEAQKRYIDRPYAEWRRPGPPRPLPMPAPISGGPTPMYPGSSIYEPIPCKIRQWSDETGCTVCGLRWDTNDPDPPRCPRLAVARGRVALGRHYPSTPSPYRYQTGSLWPLWLALAVLAAAVGWVHGPSILAWLMIQWLGLGF